MTKRILAGFGVLVLLIFAFTGFQYSSWRSDKLATLRSQSQLVETSKGSIEYRMWGDEGPVLLFLHGTPGGYDQYTGEKSESRRFRVLVPSRPGYLRTPIEVGRTPEDQADAYAALLDALRIDSVVVMGASGGAPSTLTFAAKYPERTRAVIALVALSQSEEEEEEESSGWIARLFQTDFATWFFIEVVLADPERLVSFVIPDPGNQARVLNDPKRVERLETLVESVSLPSLRKDGTDNDRAQYSGLNLPVEVIQSPTLIIHGTADTNVAYQQSKELAERIPGSELFTIDGGDHFISVTHADEIGVRIDRFLIEALGRPLSK